MQTPPNPFTPFLATDGVVILDGALATELENRGADLKDPLWSARLLIENPQLIAEVHSDYFRAGADVAITASYQATFAGFAERGLSRSAAAELMVRSVALAREARDRFFATRPANRLKPLIAASVGPYGAALHDGSEFRGDYGLSVGQLVDFHRPRLEILAGAGPDLFACETVPCRAEAEALVQVLADHPGIPAWLSFSCQDGRRVCHGETLAECASVAASCPQIVAIGVNCTAPQYVAELLKSMVPRPDQLRLAYPNSGEQWDASDRCFRPVEGAGDWGVDLTSWFDAGARLIGGCCRTTPSSIRRLASVLCPGRSLS
jgi:homocysteine S-methyltransferase